MVCGAALLLGNVGWTADNAEAWRAVARIRGSVTLETREWIEEKDDKLNATEAVTVRFVLARDRSDEPAQMALPPGLPAEAAALLRSALTQPDELPASTSWRAEKAEISGSRSSAGYNKVQGTITQQASYSGTPAKLQDFFLVLDFESGKWQTSSPGFLRDQYPINVVAVSEVPGLSGTWSTLTNIVPNGVFDGTVSGKPGAFGGPVSFTKPNHLPPTRGYVMTGTIRLWPEFDDVAVDVTIEGYDKWRPLGTIVKPGTPGNSLVARATLVPKGGRVEDLPAVKTFRFQLLDTSREPGVCLNWPLNAKDDDYDLRLAAAPPFLGTLSAKDQSNEVGLTAKDDQGRPYAETKIDSYDFGGRASLRVICTLTDGREIIGVMKDGGRGEDLIRLPKMSGAGWIATAWKEEKGVAALADDDDSEKVEGQPMDGDGYTLYEEYRGWAENGQHVEGDPKAKELFVLNRIGADAIGGFKLFERESKVKIRYQLRPAEMSEEARLMNGNHRDAPHRVDQHGVWIFNADGTGIPEAGTTGMTAADAGRAFRPGRVRYIVIETRTISDAIFGMARSVGFYKLTERDAVFAYDRAVAHELLHAVGVDHHGEGEDANEFYFVAASDPNNSTHRAGFSPHLPQTSDIDLRKMPGYIFRGDELKRWAPVQLLWEDTGRNLAEELAPMYERKLAAERARRAANPPAPNEDPGRWATQYPQYGKSAAYWQESAVYDAVAYNNDEFKVRATIGEPGQADSGHELCLMRYYFATAYPVKGQTKTYYVVRPGQNRAGRTICRAPAGTGANAASHQPQSRFGDSSPGRGNCFAQICPNDAIPPRSLH